MSKKKKNQKQLTSFATNWNPIFKKILSQSVCVHITNKSHAVIQIMLFCHITPTEGRSDSVPFVPKLKGLEKLAKEALAIIFLPLAKLYSAYLYIKCSW